MLDIDWINDLALFGHVLAAAGMIGGGIVQVMGGFRLRAATQTSEVRTWAEFTRSAGLLIAASAAISLFTGGHLAANAPWTMGSVSGFSVPFITLGMLGLVLLAPVGPMVGGARLRRLAAAADEGSAMADADLRAAANDPTLWGPVHSLLGVGVGFVWIMTTKPDWAAGAVGLLVTFAAGWAVGVMLAQRTTAGTPAPAGR